MVEILGMRSLHQTLLFCALLFTASVSRADTFPPPRERIGSSADGRFIVRLGAKIQVFVLAPEESGYRLASEFDSGTEGTPLKALISQDGKFVVTLDGGRGMGRGRDVVSVFESGGKKLREWSLDEILQKSDLDIVEVSVSSTWWREEALVAGPKPRLIVTGPKEGFGSAQRRYRYQLDLENLKWSKLR